MVSLRDLYRGRCVCLVYGAAPSGWQIKYNIYTTGWAVRSRVGSRLCVRVYVCSSLGVKATRRPRRWRHRLPNTRVIATGGADCGNGTVAVSVAVYGRHRLRSLRIGAPRRTHTAPPTQVPRGNACRYGLPRAPFFFYIYIFISTFSGVQSVLRPEICSSVMQTLHTLTVVSYYLLYP